MRGLNPKIEIFIIRGTPCKKPHMINHMENQLINHIENHIINHMINHNMIFQLIKKYCII